MNENEIPKRDFDDILNFFKNIIESYQKDMTPPQKDCFQRINLLTTVIDKLDNIRLDTEKEIMLNRNNYPRILPIHRGYTADFKLKQFRKINQDNILEIIPFNSTIGESILLRVEEERPDIMKEVLENM
jgi:hypothetical protein